MPLTSSEELAQPLAPGHLSASVQQLLAGPVPAQMMAARGIAPLRPADLALALYQLGHASDEAIQQAALQSPSKLPEAILLSMVAAELPAPVLNFFAHRIPLERTAAWEPLLLNPGLPDVSLVHLAERLPEALLELVFGNEARLLRCPAVVEALFANPQARMSSVTRAVELCARNGVVLDIPGFEDVVRSIAETREAGSGASDEAFAAMAQTAQVSEDCVSARPVQGGVTPAESQTGTAMRQGDGRASPAPRGAPSRPENAARKATAVINFTQLKLHEKIRLAAFGNTSCRTHLIRDPNRVVAMSVAKSGKMTDAEVEAAAGDKNVHGEVIRFIGGSRDMSRNYPVRLALVNNPKCPPQMAVRFLATLNSADLKKVARSRNIPIALKTHAKRMLSKKS